MKLYVVRNKQGKFFRAVGQNSYRKNWVDTLEEAKFYAKLGQAKSRVTYFFKSDPSYGCPEILEFEIQVGAAKVLNVEGETNKKIKKASERELKYQIEYKERQRVQLLEEQERIKQKLKNL